MMRTKQAGNSRRKRARANAKDRRSYLRKARKVAPHGRPLFKREKMIMLICKYGFRNRNFLITYILLCFDSI